MHIDDETFTKENIPEAFGKYFFNIQLSTLSRIITNKTILMGDFNLDLKKENITVYDEPTKSWSEYTITQHSKSWLKYTTDKQVGKVN